MNARYLRQVGERSNSNLAATKLRPPAPPARLVDRARLGAVLDEADVADVPLVLISAPAGSGKSTLAAGWAATHQGAVAWLQLEESDADPARFWVSVTTAIGRANPEVAAHLEPLVAGSLGVDQVVVPALVNELSSLTERLVVVLDDYHVIDDPEVHRAVERLIDLCPPQLTVVLITRADPPFRLGRMRVRGRVREIRSGDLRFDPAEAVALLVAGYLTDEFLAVLGEQERRRMVEAAVLHRLSGPLLDAVTGSDDGARWLDGLAASNQLVIRLDAVGQWYRYHHLFRDMLLLEARRSIPDRLPDLHRRAAAWFETSDHPAAAVDHLLAAGDREQAMYLMRFVGPELLGSGQLRTLRNILGRLSADGELDAICSILSGWDHYLTGRYEQAQHLLDRATATLPDDVDPTRTMPLRINLALGKGDVATALVGAREVIAAGDVQARPSELTTATGAAFAWAGLPEEARAAIAIALARTHAEKRVTAHAMALVAAAIVEYHSTGDEVARAAAQRALDFATTSGLGEYHGIAPAVAIRAATAPSGATATADAEHAVVLAHRATTRLGLVFVLTLAGDVLLREGVDRGRELLDEAHQMIKKCADPGITLPLLERAAARHWIPRSRPAPTVGQVEQLSQREIAVLRYLPSTLSLPDIARELYVSPNTVKTQCNAIYRKLAVTNRKAAVQAAREHRLL